MKEFQYKEVYVVLDGPADPSSLDPIHSSVFSSRDDAINCMDVIMAFSDLRDRSMSIWKLQVNVLCTEQDIQEVVRDLTVMRSDGPSMIYATRERSHAFLGDLSPLSA